jgi:acetyltransferase-like isoleucine patch superfamily enzyme
LKNMAKLVDLQVVGELKSEEDIKAESNWDTNVSYNWDSNVTQFPVNLEKSLEFTSRRGHTFVFPSSNIAYVAQTSEEDFNQIGVNCFSVMNVVQYSDKEFVEQKWNVKVYECTAKNGIDDSDKKLIYKQIWDKHFIVEIIDPAWVTFANNIEIKVN